MGVPAATPITFKDWLEGISGIGKSSIDFERQVREMLKVPYVRGVNSGRAALFLILAALRQNSGRDEVIIPAFVCPSVGQAVVKAGLKVIVCDVTASGSGLDQACLAQLVSARTLAVVTAHLFGYPSPIEATLAKAHASQAVVIEDACQAFGATLNGRYVGTFGDFGVFSFGMSKAAWTGGGGLIVTAKRELIRCIDASISDAPKPHPIAEVLNLSKVGVLAGIVRSQNLGPLARIWAGMLRGKDDCLDFDAGQYSGSNAAIGLSLLPRLAAITRARSENASYYFRKLSGYDSISLPVTHPRAMPVCVRFPLTVHSPSEKREILKHLRAKGINASEMYSRESYDAIKGLAQGVAKCTTTEYLVDRMVDLPTHPYVTKRNLEDAVTVFDEVLAGKRATKVKSPLEGSGAAHV